MDLGCLGSAEFVINFDGFLKKTTKINKPNSYFGTFFVWSLVSLMLLQAIV